MSVSLGLGPPVQIAYAVPDARVAAADWSARLGAGPFFLREHVALDEVVYRGRPAAFDHTSAYGQWGSIMVELIQDHGVGPSVVRERFAPHESGLHHVAVMVDDLGSCLDRLADSGISVAMSARTAGGVEFHFADCVAGLGHFVEVYQRSDRLTAFYDLVADAARGWNGAEPIRLSTPG